MRVLAAVATAGYLAWLFASFTLPIARALRVDTTILKSIRMELHPFRWALVGAAYVLPFFSDHDPGGFWHNTAFAMNLLNCWLYRKDKDDDDRWKRRREKLAAMVAEVGGKLQIVPAGAS